MKITLLLAMAFLLAPARPVAGQTAGDETTKASSEAKAGPRDTAKAVAVDELFLEVYENYNWTLREIERIEGLSGQVEIRVSIRELRKQSQEKLARLRAWMSEHKVGDNWSYDAGGKRFLPPPPAPKAEEKK